MIKANLSLNLIKTKANKPPLLMPQLCIGGMIVVLFIIGMALGMGSLYNGAIIIGSCAMIILLLLRQDELAAAFVLIIHIYVDWYLGRLLVGPLLTCILLVCFYLTRSPQYPWSKPRALWLWSVFLALAIFPAFRGFLSLSDGAYYYPNMMLGALLTLWLGTIVARDITHTRRFFQILAAVGTALAIITIIQNETGILLFGTSRFDATLASTSNFALFHGSNIHRTGGFFENPDWNGVFFAIIFCVPLGLFIESRSPSAKLIYLAETLIILLALLFTYSVGSWISAGIALFTLTILIGNISQRIWIALFFITAAVTLFIGFPEQIASLLQHESNPASLAIRQGAWQTAIKVIEAFPLTGIGLSLHAYLIRAEPYRVPAQYIPLAHPHESYLELGAMAGIPAMMAFIALLVFALWLALRNWKSVDIRQRALLGGGIAAVIALCVNSFSVNAWTLPPLAATGWLILGVVSSPLLARNKRGNKVMETGDI